MNLQGRFSYGATSEYSFDNTQTLGRAQVTASEPHYSSGLNEARVAEARALNDADWRAMDQTLRDLRQSVADSWGNLVSTRLSITSFAGSVEAAQKAYEGAVIQQRAGDRSTQDVLILARELLENMDGGNALLYEIARVATAIQGTYCIHDLKRSVHDALLLRC